ncbi:GDSL Lipase/Acylhydrolase family protein-like protein [Hyaloscypha finlandica]|nr:GDSL Lipase/Acylhydrolase family protein-like protein [Hyaloscypha finlandica]
MEGKRYPQFLLIGDSIVQFSSLLRDGFCFGAGLEEHCQRRLDVINRGLSGYNTAHTLAILQDLIPSTSCAKVDYLLILFGANDACLKDGPTSQHVPLQIYRENLKTILNHSSITAHSPTIFLVTPPPINEVHLEQELDLKKGFGSITRHQKVTAQYADVVREVAREHEDRKVVLVDLWEALMDARLRLTPTYVGQCEKRDDEVLRKLLVDGLHLTGDGYKVFLDKLLPLVGKEWAFEPLDNPSWIFPHWSIAPKME